MLRRLARTVPASECSGTPSVAVTVTTTPSRSSRIELAHMEHAVDPTCPVPFLLHWAQLRDYVNIASPWKLRWL